LVTVSGDLYGRLVAAIAGKTRSITECLSGLSEEELRSSSDLPLWSRLTIACHLRYGAEALTRMTRAALMTQEVAYYPEGRKVQRPHTLVPFRGESALAVVESLIFHSDQLDQLWRSVDLADWNTEVVEPPGNPDLGSVPLGRLPLLRLTEVEVHGSDLGLNVEDWGDLFIDVVLPMRLDWLNARRANHRDFDANLEGSWLLVATDGPTYRISVEGSEVESRPARPTSAARAVIQAPSRDLLALLLGRAVHTQPVITGDIAFGEAFTRAFPGP
jgi:hypothetical protein